MAKLKSLLFWVFLLVIAAGAGAFVVVNYSWVFAKRIHGEIMDVQRVTNPTAIMGKTTDAQIHSYAILIQNEDGKLYTASSDDRQWQVARRGYCVDALFYVYPPWNLEQAGTYFNARLNEMRVCPGKSAPPPEPAQAEPAPAAPIVVPPSGNQ